MDFFNSLAQVAKNQKNFKTWEDEQSNNNAQRQELAQRRQYTKAELEAAKQLIDADDKEMAMTYLTVAINSGDNEEVRNEAMVLYDQLMNNQ